MRLLIALLAVSFAVPLYAERSFVASEIDLEQNERISALEARVDQLESRAAQREARQRAKPEPVAEPVTRVAHSPPVTAAPAGVDCGSAAVLPAAVGCGAATAQAMGCGQSYQRAMPSAAGCAQPVMSAGACGSRAVQPVRRRGLFRRLFSR